ncbi:MarR family winged helix-turn-helix transcriptional regulator [Streptomyces sp. MMG1121]|uniref:MarR family winged helix-turn-helix transcriptional regulator n=1 Tax=Streptomyces sp. MMG1121 TaxID=1415544 RepID=UPI0006AEDE95|nr:MarR family transcriptional regulator [Streptomyces sp. MMG1121]
MNAPVDRSGRHRTLPTTSSPSAQTVAPGGIFGRLMSITQAHQDVLISLCAQYGLRSYDVEVLALLRHCAEGEGMSASRLARGVNLTSGGITARIDRLERAGLVVRCQEPRDRRALRVLLTEEGRAMADRLAAETARVQRAALQYVPHQRLSVLEDLLGDLERGIQASQAKMGRRA